METVSRIVLFLTAAVFICGCSSKKVLKEEEGAFEDIRQEYEKVVHVKEVEDPKPKAKPQTKAKPKSKAQPEPKPVAKAAPKPKMKKRQPSLEDSEGFDGRRPIADPFRIGEFVTLNVKYFNMNAGEATFKVEPFKEVNGKKSYHFSATVKSNKRFAIFYKVENRADTFMDFEELIPYTLSLDNNESSRLVESKTFFDWKKGQATLWEKKVREDKAPKKKFLEWEIDPYTQNIISALFYLRNFTLKPGKKFSFRVSDDGKNYIFNGTALRREVLDTDLGKIKTIVIRPEFQLDGSFKPSGENLIWLTDDDRKLMVRLESKVKIGTLIGELKAWNRAE